MQTNTRLSLSLIGLVLAAGGATALGADDQQSSSASADETVTVVVRMPDGRTLRVEERAQPSRTEGVSEGTTVRRVLPDGSRISYGTGDQPRGRRAPARTTTTLQPKSNASGVSTIGQPTYSDDSATGGQTVSFDGSGLSAMVVGRTVFVWGARLVQSDEAFEVIEGERFAFDGVMARRLDAGVSASEDDPLYAPIKLEYESNTVVNLTLHARASNPDDPDCAIRTWTFRVR